MTRRAWAPMLLLLLLLATGAVLWQQRRSQAPQGGAPAWLPHELRPATEAELRAQFERLYPRQRPANWAIAKAARTFRQTRPMGQFVLALTPGQWGNDCSDFVACAVDEGLGVKARFNRDSARHLLGERPWLFDSHWHSPGGQVQPGDVVSIRHSPWYPPREDSCWHCGVVGPDGQVYDFTKLKQWQTARYGCNSFAWFTRHSQGEHEVLVQRLRAEYRYRAKPLPTP